jgi:hypothetical protein
MSFSSVTIEGKRAAPDRIYYNGTVVNNSTNASESRADPQIVFQDQRQTPLVPDSSGYVVSVQNFSLNGVGKSLPLFIPQIAPPLVTATITSIGVGPTGGSTQFITYVTNLISNLQDGNQVLSFSSTDPQDLLTYPFLDLTNVTVTNSDSSGGVYSVFTVLVPGNQFTPGTYTPGGSTWTANLETINDITTTIYTVSFGIFNGGSYDVVTRPIIWEPEDVAATVPQPNSANPVQQESAYYYCYTYTHWVSLVNKALLGAWTIAGGTSFGTQCPFIEYDEVTGLFSINQDAQTCMTPYGTTLPQPYVSAVSPSTTSASGGTYVTGEYSFVGMNTCLEVLFSSFNSIHFGPGKIWNGFVLPENVINMGLTVELLTGATTATTPVGISLRTQPKTSIFQLVNPFAGTPIPYAFFARLPQDFVSTGGCWSPIASFVVGTAMIPVRNEAAGNPISFGSGNLGAVSNGGVFQKVLVEAPIDAIRADYWKGWVLYEPKIETYSSLDPSQDGISDIDIHLYWRNRLTNSLIPVTIPNQASMSFRLLFKKKVVL